MPRLPVPSLTPGGSLATGKISDTGAVIRSAVPKRCGHRAEILGCGAHFSARVNGALVTWPRLNLNVVRAGNNSKMLMQENVQGQMLP